MDLNELLEGINDIKDDVLKDISSMRKELEAIVLKYMDKDTGPFVVTSAIAYTYAHLLGAMSKSLGPGMVADCFLPQFIEALNSCLKGIEVQSSKIQIKVDKEVKK